MTCAPRFRNASPLPAVTGLASTLPLLWALLVAAPAGAESPTPVGTWEDSSLRIKVEIAPCGDRLCGKLLWIRRRSAAAVGLLDTKNHDRALRNRPLLGLTILEGLRRTGDNTWVDGRIYNPDDGVDYQAKMSMRDDGSLKVRAYVLLPLLGKTYIWTRVPQGSSTN